MRAFTCVFTLTLALAFALGALGAGFTGQLLIAGSTSVQPLSEELAQEFMARHPGVNIIVQGGGSVAGITAARAGAADLGSSSRELTAAEAAGLKVVEIARDGIAIVVHPANPVNNLTSEQIHQIFAGKITNWSQVGGRNEKILVIIRSATSGTRGAFEELALKGDKPVADATVEESTGAVMSLVYQEKRAVGYISMGSLDGTVKAVRVDGVAPTEDQVRRKAYRIARPFLYLSKGEPSPLAKVYLDFVLSKEGQAIVARDYIAVRH